tara:strand:+ start:4147 stop:5466 length:1320 start_codon:yes stop_codon:yes gene_type:complete
VRATVYGVDGNSDTYITNLSAVVKIPAFDSFSSKFIELSDVEQTTKTNAPVYTGGDSGNLMYRARNILKVGGTKTEKFRTVLLLNPRQYFSAAVDTLEGYTAGSPYTIGNATLRLTRSTGTTGGLLEAVLLPLDTTIDSSVSWYKPSEAATTGWTTEGGDTELAASEIIPVGSWSGSTVEFDLTPFLNIWDSRGYSLLAVLIRGEENSSSITEFYSWESENTPIGGGTLQNCKFLAGGDTNTIQTEGIRVLVSVGSETTVSLADDSAAAVQQWNSFGAATSVGTTFSFFSPDTEQGIVLETVTCTLTGRTTTDTGSPLVVTGISLGAITEYYTTAEFSSTSIIPTGTNILEITSPNTQTKTAVAALFAGETLLVNYRAGTAASNAHSFTVKFTSDETLKQSRVRVYLNETTISENRIGLNTDLLLAMNRPTLTADLLLV